MHVFDSCELKVFLKLGQLEMMSEAIDETLDKDEAEEETEELTNQVSTIFCLVTA